MIRFTKKVIGLIGRFKVRHLKLGFIGVFKLARWHLVGSPSEKKSRSDSDWLITPPSISILLTVYNQTALELSRSIGSARAQLGTHIEILILDDGSTKEETVQFLKDLRLEQNEKIFFEPNQGVVKARNFLIAKASTDYIVFLDPDDSLDDNYLSRVTELLMDERDLEIVYPNVLIHDIASDTFEIWGTGPFDSHTLSKVNMIPMSSVISAKLIRMLGGFAEDFQSGYEDWDLWYRASLCEPKTRHLPKIGYFYTKAPVSRTTIMVDNSDLIRLRGVGKSAHFPFSLKNKIDIFLVIPFLPRIGGVEKYVKLLMSDITKAGLSTALIITESDPFGYPDDADYFRCEGNIVIKRINYRDKSLFTDSLRSLSTKSSIAINFGSPWAFNNLKDFNDIFPKNVAFVFNEEISFKRANEGADYFDEIWVAYERISHSFSATLKEKVHTIFTGIIDGGEPFKEISKRNKFTVGFLGRLSVEKSPEKFIKIALLAQDESDIVFKIGGEGPLEDTVKSQIKSMKNVSFEGFIKDTTGFISSLDCLLITSEIEGIPLVAMEALNLGVPIVSSNVGGLSELIISKDQGIIWEGSVTNGFKAVMDVKNNLGVNQHRGLLDPKFWRTNTSNQVVERLKNLMGH